MKYKFLLINLVIKKIFFSFLKFKKKIKIFFLKKKLNIFFNINFPNFNFINNTNNNYDKIITFNKKKQNKFIKIPCIHLNCKITKIISSIKYNITDVLFCTLRKIIDFFLSKILKNNFLYNEVDVPVIINYSNLLFSGQIPKFYNFLFKIENKNCFLIPTSEVILNSFSFFIKKNKKVKIFSNSLCFRKEMYNLKNDFGLKRHNQFQKIEIFQFINKKISIISFYNMCSTISNILKFLKIKFRLLKINNLNLNKNTFYSFDFEVLNNTNWVEISSLSLCLNKPFYFFLKKKNLHIINGSCFPIGRLIFIIINNYRFNNRFIKIPKILNKYLTELLKW